MAPKRPHAPIFIGVEKSPDTAFSESRLAACLAHNPGGRFVHLVRRPVSNITSLARYALVEPPGPQAGGDLGFLDSPTLVGHTVPASVELPADSEPEDLALDFEVASALGYPRQAQLGLV